MGIVKWDFFAWGLLREGFQEFFGVLLLVVGEVEETGGGEVELIAGEFGEINEEAGRAIVGRGRREGSWNGGTRWLCHR